jgi:superfamily I DNA/RNA helicase/mRNA-degrading endonuclease RelE of RelBE toxin-antitoxin system
MHSTLRNAQEGTCAICARTITQKRLTLNFLIADSFTASLAKLTNEEQKAVKTAAFDLQLNPAHPGIQLHKLDGTRDKRFWSARASSDLRLILHRTEGSLLLCYVGHHDDAYTWGQRRKLEVHPTTGAAQLVEVLERTVVEAATPTGPPALTRKAIAPVRPLAHVGNTELLSYGVPEEWLAALNHANEDEVLEIAGKLPSEAMEAVLQLAVGRHPSPAPVMTAGDPFTHPDAMRRFRVLADREELAQALDFPWEKWTIFLHPAQRDIVERKFNGPARVSGTAGTGKTIVAIHRAAFLARADDDARVLLTTLNETLAIQLHSRLRRLLSTTPRVMERFRVEALDAVALRFYERIFALERPIGLADTESLTRIASQVLIGKPGNFSVKFVLAEWYEVVDAWQLQSWEDYRDFRRLGRKIRLPEAQRAQLWAIFESLRNALLQSNLATMSAVYYALAQHYENVRSPFEHIIIDEAQDLSPMQLRFVASLGHEVGVMRPQSLFFAGDLGQRIFQSPFSWKALGIEVRGRSSTLAVNYRTSHQIRMAADRLLGKEVSDVDGNTDSRLGCVSVFDGVAPLICRASSIDDEIARAGHWIQAQIAKGAKVHECAVFVRDESYLPRALRTVAEAKLTPRVLDNRTDFVEGAVSVSTMHRAKGLEFRAVVVMACDEDAIPLKSRLEVATETSDLEEIYDTERHLLYVACTRARDALFVSGVAPGSEFMDDLG